MWIILIVLIFARLTLGIVKDAILIFKNIRKQGDKYND